MLKILWAFGKRYELSGDGIGLLKYFSPSNYYHIHSNEMTGLERIRHKILKRLNGKSRYI